MDEAGEEVGRGDAAGVFFYVFGLAVLVEDGLDGVLGLDIYDGFAVVFYCKISEAENADVDGVCEEGSVGV